MNAERIIIYRDGNKVIAKDSLTGRKAEAKCSPEDTFDFYTGANLSLQRLSENRSVTEQDIGKFVDWRLNGQDPGWTRNKEFVLVGIINGKAVIASIHGTFATQRNLSDVRLSTVK